MPIFHYLNLNGFVIKEQNEIVGLTMFFKKTFTFRSVDLDHLQF